MRSIHKVKTMKSGYHENEDILSYQSVPDHVNIEMSTKKPGLVMGKQKKVLASTLDYEEKKVLKEAIQEECKAYA